MFTSRLGINPVATPVMRFMKTTIETGSDTFPSAAAAAGMVSETGNTRVVSDNTVTTLLRRDLLAEITTGEGLGKLDQPGVAGASDGQGRAELGVYRCRDRLLISGNLPDFGL